MSKIVKIGTVVKIKRHKIIPFHHSVMMEEYYGQTTKIKEIDVNGRDGQYRFKIDDGWIWRREDFTIVRK